jgi:hypothetical protein
MLPWSEKSTLTWRALTKELAGIRAGLSLTNRASGASQPRSSNAERLLSSDVSTRAVAAEGKMSDGNASSSSAGGALEFAEHAGRQRAAQYREQAAYFRSLAEMEPLASLRRHLIALARQYEELAAGAEVQPRE